MTATAHAPSTILVVEDAASMREALCELLEDAGHRTLQAADAQQAVERFVEGRPDIVLLDVELPDHDGYWVARQMRAAEAGGWTPIIFLSGHADEQSLWNGIEAGGDDYIAKPVSMLALKAKLHAMRRLARMRERLIETAEQLQRANEQLEHLSLVDPLTGLRNRRDFASRLETEIAASRREGTPLTLILCDVDHFKLYNDSLGHPAGDACLVEIAKVLHGVCRRPRDSASRYGGEEFALLLPNTPRSGALTLARALQHMVALRALPHPKSPVSSQVTLSGGITTCVPDADTTAQGMLLRADEALYTAKSAGRARFFSFEMQVAAVPPPMPSAAARTAPAHP